MAKAPLWLIEMAQGEIADGWPQQQCFRYRRQDIEGRLKEILTCGKWSRTRLNRLCSSRLGSETILQGLHGHLFVAQGFHRRTAASAAWIVVMQGTPRATAAARIRPFVGAGALAAGRVHDQRDRRRRSGSRAGSGALRRSS